MGVAYGAVVPVWPDVSQAVLGLWPCMPRSRQVSSACSTGRGAGPEGGVRGPAPESFLRCQISIRSGWAARLGRVALHVQRERVGLVRPVGVLLLGELVAVEV